jgi:16S rRNA (uracil1498-N3)-methyltransferase
VHLFYFPDLSAETVSLDEDESKHAVRVLRLEKGDSVELVDGKGTRASAEVADNHPKRCTLRIVSRKQESTNRRFGIHIAIAPTKNADRLEWFAEKAVEIGIDSISLLHCDHSEKEKVKTERLEKLAIAAMKQSQQSWLPQIRPVQSFTEFLRQCPSQAQRFIAHCEETKKRHLKSAVLAGGECIVLIGPEGDFSPEEIKAATAAGFIPVSLGETRLRTETAALYALTAIHFVNS